MATVYVADDVWQQATFKFTVIKNKTGTVDNRGNEIVDKEEIDVTFRFLPVNSRRYDFTNVEQGDEMRSRYDCNVISVNGDQEVVELPKSIKPNDVGVGSLRDRPCRATVINISQSSVVPILIKVLGEKVVLELDYSIGRAVSA